MADRNWGIVTSGATFEALATTLIFFEDPAAALFGRRGRDGGQDARSGDGTRVFQAKHHQDGSAAKAIADAKREAAKIADYRASGHPRYPQWRGVTHWRLVTNAAFNPTDKQTWDDDVVPLFQEQGLMADYWEQANLDALLEKHPEVDRAYFQNETRAFLSLPEVKELLPGQEPFLRRDSLGTFVGRDTEVEDIQSFLRSDYPFLVVHGAGGVGKTRMVVEAGEQIAAKGDWQVLWANVASLEASGTWFEAIVPERPTLLIVDEPEDEKLLRVLAEQISGRASQWKVVITVRSPKDPVLKFLVGPRMKRRVKELCVATLPQGDAESMCIDLLGSGPLAHRSAEWQSTAAKELSERFSSHPVWLTLALHVLENTDDLSEVPETAEDLAAHYLAEVFDQQSDYAPDTVRALLRWVALVGTLNRENDTAIELIAENAHLEDPTAAKKALASLVDRRALAERGARNRFVEVKPDVLRDHLLLKWLSVDVGYGENPVQPSEDAKELAAMILRAMLGGKLNAVGRAILTSLARTELALDLSDQAVELLAPLVQGIQQGISKVSASTRMSIAETLVDIAVYRPEDTVKLSQVLRTSACDTERIEGIFGSRDIGHDEVVLKLAWPVFHAALGAQSPEARQQVLTELCELAEAESHVASRQPHGLPNDGKRAKNLIGRTLEGGPQFWSDFEDAASAVATRLLDDLADLAPTPARLEVLKSLMEPALSVERRQIWSEGYTFHIQTSTIAPDHPAWATREALKTKIKTLLESGEIPTGTRLALWSLFAEAHRSLNQHHRRKSSEAHQVSMRQDLLDDLTWAYSVLSPRASDLDEVSAARNLWDWHVRFEKDSELRKAAENLEGLYMSNAVAAEFEQLLASDRHEARGERATEKANELASSGRAAIEAFLERATSFFGNDQELYQVSNVAWKIGEKLDDMEGAHDFIRAMLGESSVTPRTDFATIAATSWAATRRRRESASAQSLVAKLVDACGSDAQKINLLLRIYGQMPRSKGLGNLSDDEYRFVRSHERLFVEATQGPEFLACIAWGMEFDWEGLRALVERVLDAVPNDQIAKALSTLVDALGWGLRKLDPEEIPSDLSLWLLDQLLRVHDPNSLGRNLEWHIGEFLQQVGKAPLKWLPGALMRRRDLELEHENGNVRALSHRVRLSRFVDAIPKKGEVHPEAKDAVSKLLDLASDTGSVGYFLPQILRDVDPHGRVVPDEVARRFTQTDELKAACRLARVGGRFPIGAPPWRVIAKPVLARAKNALPEERKSLYAALADHGIRSWSGTPGEVPAIFRSEVESARKCLEAETDSDFRSFWEWRLSIAEAELRDQEELAKEERGE